jgi:long-chain fatty acid transport protein
MRRRTTHCLLAGALATALAPSIASAGGFYVARFGGEQGGVTSSHVVSLYFNPAGLAFDSGTRIYVEGTGARRDASYERPVDAIGNVADATTTGANTPIDGISANSGSANLGNWLASPFIGAASDVGVPGLAVAMGVYAPFGGSASWDTTTGVDAYPGSADGVQRWWALDGSLRSLYYSGAAAYKIPNIDLSFGAAVSFVDSSVNTIRARTITGTDDLVTPTGDLTEGRSLVDVRSNDVAVGLGVHWRPIKRLKLGASYQSQPGLGEMKLKGVLTTKLATSPATESNVEMRQSLPDIWRAGAEFAVSKKLNIKANLAFARWSVFEKQCLLDRNLPERKCALTATGSVDTDAGGAGIVANLPRDWKNTWTASLGMNYDISESVHIMAGASYDTSAVPDRTLDPALMDMNKFSASLGARIPITKLVNVSLQLAHVLYLDRDIAPRDSATAPMGPSRGPDAAGKYSQSVSLMSLGVETRF